MTTTIEPKRGDFVYVVHKGFIYKRKVEHKIYTNDNRLYIYIENTPSNYKITRYFIFNIDVFNTYEAALNTAEKSKHIKLKILNNKLEEIKKKIKKVEDRKFKLIEENE